MIEYTVKIYDDRTEWFLNGNRHREDGPAVEFSDGHKEWFLNGKRHRTDGPAIEYSNGDKEWYLDGKKCTTEEFNRKTKVKEMTVSELEKVLGYPVKIVK